MKGFSIQLIVRFGALFMLLLPPSLQATGIPGVQVQCELAEARYRIGVSEAAITAAESQCSALLAELLGNRIKFVRFESQAQDKQLIVRVGKTAQEADPMEIRPIDMEIRLTGSGLPEQPKPIYWSFRKIEEWLSVPAIDTFADDVVSRFAAELENKEAELVESQLSQLVIADDAWVLPDDMSWLLPFTREELQLGDDSVLNIKASLKRQGSEERFLYTVTLFGDFSSAEDVPLEYHHKVKALHLRDDKLEQAPSIERVKSADNVDVIYVVVNRYVPMVEPLGISPSELTHSQGGPQ